ncbi:MAG: ATP-grasp domain-containing protein [Bacteroidetes bacterium]|nr:MAG: ATP-grasp domain-containing protein [Bacteroidota bacterium]
MKTKPTITVAVTGLNNIDSPGPGVAVIRCLRECPDFDVRIIGLSYESMEPGVYMEGIADKSYQIPYPSAGSESLLTRLRYIHEKENLQAIIPNFDAELFNFMKIAPQLQSMGIASFLPTVEQLEARDKINLSAFGQKYNMLVPRSVIVHQPYQIPQVAKDWGYPIVVKGKFYEATVAYTYEQAEKAFYKLQAKWGLPIILQEFIKGTEVNVASLGDGKGKCISAVPMRKLYITDKGKAWAGITIEDEGLLDLSNQFVKVTQWRGGFELEVMKTADNQYYIMEVNPRFPAWIYLTCASGQNQPASLLKMALGEKIEPFTKLEVGKIFLRYSWDLVIDVADFQQISAYGER